jgi:hypothetical protein
VELVGGCTDVDGVKRRLAVERVFLVWFGFGF